MKHGEVVQMRLLSRLSDKFNVIVKKYKRATPKQLVLAGVFMLALAGTIGAGFASKIGSSAATYYTPDCDANSIMKCGAPDKVKFCNNFASNNNGNNYDLGGIYGDSQVGGLTVSDCLNYFAKDAVQGLLYRGGYVQVNGQTVAENVKTVGRHGYAGTPIYLGGKKYYHGTPNQRWSSGVTVMPVMVWFDANGKAKVIIMNNCGNPVVFTPKTPCADCKKLNEHEVGKNKYQFSTEVEAPYLATYTKFSYYRDNEDEPFDVTTSASEKTETITLTKTSTIHVEIEVTFVDGKKKIIKRDWCKKVIEVKPVFHYCEAIIKAVADDNTFKFSAKPKMSEGVTVVSAEFKVDNKAPVVITDKEDSNGYKQYTVTLSEGEHYIKVTKMTFKVNGQNVVVETPHGKCKTKVEVKKVYHYCDAIITTLVDKKTFKFSAKPKMSEGITVVSAEFKLDDRTPVVITNEEDSNGYKQYTVEVSEGDHYIKVTKMTFKVNGQNVVVGTPEGECKTKVNRERECKPGIPEGDDRCKEYCKPGIEVGDPRCEECVPEGKEDGKCELPSTGPAGVAGLFAGVSVAGAVGHNLYRSYRGRRE